MTGGESQVSTAGTDTLLLDFMRVILAQHDLHKSNEIGVQTNYIWLHLDRTAPLFSALGLTPQSTEVQWMLIFKLYRELCTEVSATFRDGTPLDQAKIPFGYHIDYQNLSDEVMLDIVPYTFRKLFDSLSKQNIQAASADTLYTCRLWQDDNKLMLSFDGDSFQVARLNEDSGIAKMITKLLSLPQGRPLLANDIAPLDDQFDFTQQLSKNRYKWLKAMLSTYGKKSIALQNPSELKREDIISLLSEINEKYRKPIQEHLSIN
jgi:hypothetical protein